MAEEKKKTGYQSTWKDQITDLTKQILNREEFSYDVNGDALYKQYKDRYTQQGRQAMMDTMGQAQAMTGGYGNSYAQSVGQQTYQGYMQGLTDKIPTLYQIALDKYTKEGNQMRANLDLMMQQDNTDYGRYRDQVGDQQWQQTFDYGKERDQKADKQNAYRNLVALMTGYGYKPSAEERKAAGMSEAQMNAILGLNTPAVTTSKNASPGTKPRTGPGGGGTDGDGLSTGGIEFDKKLAAAQKNTSVDGQKWNDMSKSRMEQAYNSGQLTAEDVVIIAKKYGIT